MVAVEDPLVFENRPGDDAEHVIDGLGGPVEVDLQVHRCGSRTNVVSERQGTAPGFGRDGSGEGS